MKKCTHYRLLISRFLDNDCNESERLLLETHLATCLECKRVLDHYRAIKNLVCESFAVSVAAMERGKRSKPRENKTVAFPAFSWSWRLAAIITIIVLGVGMHSMMDTKRSFPTVIENESYSMMNTPLGTLVYYEELAGKTVHSQFTRIKSNTHSSFEKASTNIDWISEYKSPLFRDSSVLELRYSTIKNSMVF